MAKKVYSSNKSTQVVAILDYLEKEGQDIIDEAYRTKDTGNVSYNQHDAYAYAIYYYGRLMRKGYAEGGVMSTGTHRGWAKMNYPDGTGREYADGSIDAYKASTKAPFTMIVLNGIYYSNIHERKWDFKILSQEADRLEILAKTLKGGTVRPFAPAGK